MWSRGKSRCSSSALLLAAPTAPNAVGRWERARRQLQRDGALPPGADVNGFAAAAASATAQVVKSSAAGIDRKKRRARGALWRRQFELA